MPFLSKYERTRVLGQRAKQINSGARPFIDNVRNIIDGYIIAEMELNAKLIPFIIRRPLPNGGSEYWKLADLQIL
jgi:DNA-directed RNA polymerase subunit K/omega